MANNLFGTNSGLSERSKELARFLTSVPPAETYGQQEVGPRFGRSFEIQSGIPVDGSNASLRGYSPFIIEMVPPLVFGNNPALEDGIKPNKVGLIEAAYGSFNAFEKAKSQAAANRLRQMSFMGETQLETLEQLLVAGKFQRKGRADGSGYTQSAFKEPAIANKLTAIDIAIQLNKLMRTPPLALLINPTNMSIQHTKIQQYTDRTRFGYVFQAWGEEQPKLTFSGKTGAFLSGSSVRDIQRSFIQSSRGQSSTSSGMQFASKRNSASWQNLMSLFNFYMSSGTIFDSLRKSYAAHFVGALAIKYDKWTYVGHINSFSYGYEDSSPNGGLVFDIDFTVSQMFDNAATTNLVRPLSAPTTSPSDPRYSGTQGRDLRNSSNAAILTNAQGISVDNRRSSLSTAQYQNAEQSPEGRAPTTSTPRTGGFRVSAPQVEDMTTQIDVNPTPFGFGLRERF